MKDIRILFVEDEDSLRDVLVEVTAAEGYRAEGVSSAEAALQRLSSETFDIVVTDVTLPGISGLDLLPRIAQLYPGIIPIVITAHGTIDIAVEAMKRGATDFLTKPIAIDGLLSAMSVAAERASRSLAAQRNSAASPIIATSTAMKALLTRVTAIAPFNTTVLVTGETGTGKELIARAIHQQSPRNGRTLIALNCAAIPESLLEDELFGHVKGAFTGAQGARQGRFEKADGGTLFLDEVGEMSLAMQAKLLRVLQEREFEKIGSSQTVKVDVRIIAATSANLERLIEEGRFRPDLYYRLNVFHLRVPPLREHPDDIRPLGEQVLARFCVSAGLPVKQVEEQVWPALVSYHWPGNVRQLQNVMERAAALSGTGTMIRLSDIADEVHEASLSGAPVSLPLQAAAQLDSSITDGGVSLNSVVANVEREMLLQALEEAGGNKTRAAKLLKMKRTTFIEKLKRLELI